MRHNAAADFAETILSPQYREAANATFEQNPETYHEMNLAAQEIIFNGLKGRADIEQRAWETRRLAALSEARGDRLGNFGDYIHDQGGVAKPSELELVDLAPGKPEMVRINSKIMDRNQLFTEPIDFFSSALDVIDSPQQGGKKYRGPENYATAIKFFADKYNDFPSQNLSKTTIRQLVNRCMDGFFDVAAKDKPNFVEMTNLYYAIRVLPKGTFDPKYNLPLLIHSLEQLPTFNAKTLSVSRAAVSKLDLTEIGGEVAADFVDLTMRKGRTFETTLEMRRALRAIANLPTSAASNRAFATFLGIRNNLEEPLDLAGADEVNEQLAYIVAHAIDSPELTQKAKQLAGLCAQRAVNIVRHEEIVGDVTLSQLKQLKETAQRVINNYSRI